MGVDVTRRELLMAAGAIKGSPLVVQTAWPQDAMAGFKVTMTTLFWVGEQACALPFYVALPYGEFSDANELKIGAQRVPWYRPSASPLLFAGGFNA